MNKLTAEKCRTLINRLGEERRALTINAFVELYLQALEIALPVLEQQDGWISCSERMPEETEVFGGDDFSPDVLTINQHGEQWVGRTHWGKWINTKHSDCVVTHWRTLPGEPQPYTNPQIDNDGWIEWGGDCDSDYEPVIGSTTVEVKFRNGASGVDKARKLYWKHLDESADIIAYRVIENDGRKE